MSYWYIENTLVKFRFRFAWLKPIAQSGRSTYNTHVLPNHYSRILKMFTVNNKCHPNYNVHILGSLYLGVTSGCLLFRWRVRCPHRTEPPWFIRSSIIIIASLCLMFLGTSVRRNGRGYLRRVPDAIVCRFFGEQTTEFQDKITRSIA